MSRILYDCKITAIRDLSPSVRELTIEFIQPKGFTFKSGQFVMMHVPDLERGKPAQRAYSIASSPQNPEVIRLVIKVYEQGKASTFIKNLKGGESLQMGGPFGRHFFHLPATPNIVFLCTGAGISQHMSYLQSHAADMKSSKVKMLLGVWNRSEIFYEKELSEVKKNIPGFNFEYVLDKSDEQWKGKTGFVTQYFDELLAGGTETLIYLCGNPNMIKGAKEILAARNFPADKIIAEAFN